MKKEDIIVYTDGACSGNPGPGGWGSIVYLNGLVTELAGSELKTTNNRMELAATLNAIQFILQQLGSSKYNNQTVSLVGDVFVYTDSVYVIKGITQWVFGWKKKSWINSKNESVVNQDIWIDLDQSVAKLQSQLQKKLQWKYVRGHMGIAGNERCDTIAVAMSKNDSIYLARLQPYLNYEFDILQDPASEPLPESYGSSSKTSGSAGPKKIWYIVYKNGVLTRYNTWSECEATVKGASHVKFKKVSSESEEQEILKQWGVRTS